MSVMQVIDLIISMIKVYFIAGEIESNFGDRVLGNADTEHLIAPPDKIGQLVGLSSKTCVSTESGDAQLLDEESINRLKNQTPGWQVVEVDGKQRIRYVLSCHFLIIPCKLRKLDC